MRRLRDFRYFLGLSALRRRGCDAANLVDGLANGVPPIFGVSAFECVRHSDVG